jgi:hypothetical protein
MAFLFNLSLPRFDAATAISAMETRQTGHHHDRLVQALMQPRRLAPWKRGKPDTLMTGSFNL